MQPSMAEWAISRLAQTFIGLIGERCSHSSQLNIPTATQPSEKTQHFPSIPSSRTVPLGFLFVASKPENIARELVKEFEKLFLIKFGELMCQVKIRLTKKLGLQKYQESDYEILINPLLELMASTGVDYTLFFRAICSFGCEDSIYDKQVMYDPNGIHSENQLKLSNPSDCLGLLLKGLYNLKEQDKKCIEKEIEKYKRQGLTVPISSQESNPSIPVDSETSDLPILPPKNSDNLTLDIKNQQEQQQSTDIPGLKPLPFPSYDQVASSWKIWSHMYRSRILNQYPSEKRTPEYILEEDIKRQTQLKTVNPKYILRGYILQDHVKQIENLFPPKPDPERKPTNISKKVKPTIIGM